MTYAKRKDDNHNEIAQVFTDLGCLVFDTSMVPKFVDIVVQRRKPCNGHIETLLVEVKDGSKPPSQRRLTKDQVPLHAVWNIHIVECVQDVYELLGFTYVD